MARTEQIVSIIGASYLQPITDLIEKSMRHNLTQRNAVKALYYDNVYSVSVILLAVMLVESYGMRVSYLNPKNRKSKRQSTPEYLKQIFPGFRLKKSLTEVFVVRDSIAHNHLWTIDFKWRPMTLKGAALDTNSGDKKYSSIINPRTRRTRTNKIHLVPIRIDRRDSIKVLNITWKTLIYIENIDREYCYISDYNVIFRGKNIPFREVFNEYKNSL